MNHTHGWPIYRSDEADAAENKFWSDADRKIEWVEIKIENKVKLYTIKPLEWVVHVHSGMWMATTIIGDYQIRSRGDVTCLRLPDDEFFDVESLGHGGQLASEHYQAKVTKILNEVKIEKRGATR